MTDDDETGTDVAPVTGSTWAEVVRDWAGKIPEAYQKSLIKAGVRLLHSAANVGATWLDVQAKDMLNKQKAREGVRGAVAKAAAKAIKDRHDIVERAVEYYVNDIIGKQENREEVVKNALQLLAASPVPPPSTTGEVLKEIGDEWLDALSRHAENARTDRMRMLFGKILAGEIKAPGSYSLFTLDHLTKLRPQDAELIVQVAPLAFTDMIVRTPKTEAEFPFTLALKLADIGFVNPVSLGGLPTERTWMTTDAARHDGKAAAIEVLNGVVYLFTTPKPAPLKFKATLLSSTAAEILSLFDYTIDATMLGEVAYIVQRQGGELHIGELVRIEEGRVHFTNMHEVQPTSPGGTAA